MKIMKLPQIENPFGCVEVFLLKQHCFENERYLYLNINLTDELI